MLSMQTENNSPILDTALISVVNSVMFSNRIRKVVGFKFGKETEKDVFRLFTSLGRRKRYFICISYSNLY